jgi:hypothetical protein
MSPPERERPRNHHEPGPHHQGNSTFRATAYSTRHRRGSYADTWREVYARGFRDALRLAARRLPPDTWETLDRLPDDYELAGDG